MTTIFNVGETVTITGFERDCECSHCGRVLKVGIKLEGFAGVFGRDCLASCLGVAVQAGYKIRPNKDAIEKRAAVAQRGADYAWQNYGWKIGGQIFQFPVKKEIRSI